MKKEWVKYLRDPSDQTPLKIDKVLESKGGHIILGGLKSKSGNSYKIRDGIPILLGWNSQGVRSVDSFRYEWEEFDFDYGKRGWLRDIVRPTVGNLEFFGNKVVVDCGAGAGRQSRWLAEAGAKLVFCLELSTATHSIIKKVTRPYKDRVFVIQADIANPPLNPQKINIDLVYCVNVIQHTQNPTKTLRELSRLLGRESLMIFNIYLTRGRNWSLKAISLARIFTKFLPKQILKYFSLVVASILYPVSRLDQSFKELWLDIHDLLGSHDYQKFYTEKEFQEMLREAKLKLMKRSKYAFLLKRVS